MIASTAAAQARPPADERDQRIVIRGVSWKDYVVLREALDIPGLRLAFLEGALEFMSPSPLHELLKKMIARLVEAFADEREVPLYGYGSATFRREAKERGLEPDECYVVGGELRDYPDIAIEVVLTSGGLDRLAIYRGLGVREVWFWIDDAFQVFVLGDSGYERAALSGLVPGLDFEVLARFVRRTDQPQAVKEFRQAVRAGA